MAETRQIERMVVDAREAVATRATLGDALGALAQLLSERYRIARVSVRIYDPETDEIEFAGVWSDGPTQLAAGVRMPSRSTTFAEIEFRGSAILGRPPTDTASLLDQILRAEGNRSWIVAPLIRDRLVAGLLSVSSPDAGAFTEADLPFFDALAGAVGEQLLRLAST